MELKNNTKQRIAYFDVAKGILILLLLLWHFSDAMKRSGLDAANPYLLPVYIVQPLFYPFFMQAFFIISGFFMNPDVDCKTFLIKNFKTLVLPWIVFELIRMVYCTINGDFVNSIITRPEFTSLWFLNALLIGKLLAWGLYKVCENNWIALASSLLLLVAGVVLYNLKLFPNILFFEHGLVASFLVCFGCLIRQYDKAFNVLLKYSWIGYILILAGWKIFRFDLPFSTACLNVRLSTIPLYILISIAGTFSLLVICKKINSNRFLEFFGENTLVMYGIHMIPYEIIMCLLYQIMPVNNWFNGALFIVCALVLEGMACALFIKLFNTKYIRYSVGKF